MAHVLPPFPKFVFMVFEPISLVAGFAQAWFNTDYFITEQYPGSLSMLPHTGNAQMLAYQLGNLYGLCALIGLAVLNLSTEPRVVKAYILCLAIADVGHVLSTALLLGKDRALDVQSWNSVTWGNIGVTVMLFVTRVAWLLGLFGHVPKTTVKGKTF